MKRFALYIGLATALVASCSIQKEDIKTPQQDDVIYYASFEQPAEEGTRVYANEDLFLRWTADDRVSIFGKNTYNQQYKFLGETGDNSGGLRSPFPLCSTMPRTPLALVPIRWFRSRRTTSSSTRMSEAIW